MKAWRAAPQETIIESVREQLEATVEAMKELWKNECYSDAKQLSSQMLQQAITLGCVMKQPDVTDIATKFEEEILQQAFQDDNNWCDVVEHLEVLIRFQMLLGAVMYPNGEGT